MSLELMISYSREDRECLEQFRVHLSAYEDLGLLDLWVDERSLRPGELFDDKIEAAIERAGAVVFLVSPNLFHSRYIRTRELPAAFRRVVPAQPKRGLQILCLHLNHSHFRRFRFPVGTGDEPEYRSLAEFQALNDPVRELVEVRVDGRERTLSERHRIYKQAAERIMKVCPLPRPPTRSEKALLAAGEVVAVNREPRHLGFAFRLKSDVALTLRSTVRDVIDPAGILTTWRGGEASARVVSIWRDASGGDLAYLDLAGDDEAPLPDLRTHPPLRPGDSLRALLRTAAGGWGEHPVKTGTESGPHPARFTVHSAKPLPPGTPLVTALDQRVVALVLVGGMEATALDLTRLRDQVTFEPLAPGSGE